MSGLALRLRLDGRPAHDEDRQMVWAMLAAVPHRGLDGMAVREDGPLVGGHARLAITPEEGAERQPLVDSATGRWVVADVRLDNRAELVAQLSPAGGAAASDAALLLHAYSVWGAAAPAHLLGDFAFALWDPQRLRLLCARDTGGQRTLFYRVANGVLAAASEIQQLLRDPRMPMEPDDAHIREYLVPANMLRNEKSRGTTFFHGISAVLPGHVLLVEGGRVDSRPYWEPTRVAERRYRSVSECAEHFRGVLFEAVEARLRSTRPVGVMLSGGLDSSSVACAGQHLLQVGAASGARLMGFSATFPGLECDERPLIDEIVAQCGLEVRFIPMAHPGAASEEDGHPLEPRRFLQGPLIGSDMREPLFRAAAEAGVRVLLTGDMADSCVRGSPLVFDSLLRQGRLQELWRRVRHYRRTSTDSLLKIAALHTTTPLLPLAAQRSIMLAHTARSVGKQRARLVPKWMPDALRQELAARHRAILLAEEAGRLYRSPSREADFRLLYPVEAAFPPAGWPLEIWRPYADRRLHEFLLGVPPELKFAPHQDTDDWYAASKQLLRHSMQGILPERIRTRTTQTHFAAAYEQLLDRAWPVYEAAFGPGAGVRSEIARRGYVDPDRFWARLQQVRGGMRGSDFLHVLRMLALETWLRTFNHPRSHVLGLSEPGMWEAPGGTAAAVGGGRTSTTVAPPFSNGGVMAPA
jgi:asparagine synthase (glutamine-hydrolysing)